MKSNWKKDYVMGMLNYYYTYSLELSDELILRLDIFESWKTKKYEAVIKLLERSDKTGISFWWLADPKETILSEYLTNEDLTLTNTTLDKAEEYFKKKALTIYKNNESTNLL